jgi:hypothetical protein
MELRDMLDVVHYFFEEDSRYSSAEEAEAVSSVRSALYGDMYGTSYRYGIKSKNGKSSAGDTYSDPDEVKPYIPPTQFDANAANPFGAVLDAPIG